MKMFKFFAALFFIIASCHFAKAEAVKNFVLVHGGFVDGSSVKVLIAF